MAKITRLSLYITNRSKFRRLVLGMSAERVSREMKLSRGYVAMMEREYLPTQFNTHEYPNLASALKWTIQDLLPPEDWPVGDGSKVEKTVLSLANADDTRLVLEGMIGNGFFDKAKSLADTAKHLYIDGKPEAEVLEQVLVAVVQEKKLLLTNETYSVS